MENSVQLASRFREIMLNGKWIANTNYQDQLQKVDWQQATTKIDNLNSIAALSFHVNYYIEGVLQVFKGGDLRIRDKFSFDAPPIESASDWQERLRQLLEHSELFAQHIEAMSDDQLESNFVDEKYGSYRRNIEGIIEHAYYHLGQISLLRKLTMKKLA